MAILLPSGESEVIELHFVAARHGFTRRFHPWRYRATKPYVPCHDRSSSTGEYRWSSHLANAPKAASSTSSLPYQPLPHGFPFLLVFCDKHSPKCVWARAWDRQTDGRMDWWIAGLLNASLYGVGGDKIVIFLGENAVKYRDTSALRYFIDVAHL